VQPFVLDNHILVRIPAMARSATLGLHEVRSSITTPIGRFFLKVRPDVEEDFPGRRRRLSALVSTLVRA
jgi:hypothetical protein